MTYQVVIPMTGVGQRFVDAGYKNLKPLIKVGGKSILEHVINMFSGSSRIICVVSRDHDQKVALLDEVMRLRSDAVVVEIPKHKLGPGHAVLEAKSEIDLDMPTLVSYCDWAGIWHPEKMLEQLRESSGSILTYTGFHPHMLRSTKFAYVRKQDERVIDIQEKNSYTDMPMREEASAGCYGFSTGALLLSALTKQVQLKHDLNGEFYISLTYKNLLLDGHVIRTVLANRFYQWGTPQDLEDWEYWNNSISALPGHLLAEIDCHNVVLAAGRGSRLAQFADESKPNILVQGQRLWEYSAPLGLKFKSNRVVTRPEIGITPRNDVEVVTLDSVTEGQAISARIAVESIDEPGENPVNVLSSDNAFLPKTFQLAEELIRFNQMVIWTARKYPPSQLNPNNYAWINLQEKKVIKKGTPPNFIDWEMVTGNFTFSSSTLVLELIDELISKNLRVNNEFYLDSVIDLAFSRGLRIETLVVDNFFAIGTPGELQTYRYFSQDE